MLNCAACCMALLQNAELYQTSLRKLEKALNDVERNHM